MSQEHIERQVGHWLTTTTVPPDGATFHECLLCGFRGDKVPDSSLICEGAPR